MAQFRVGVTIFRNRLGEEQMDEFERFLRGRAVSARVQEHPDRDIVRLSFVVEAAGADDAQAQAERLVDEAAADLDWEPQPRAVGAVRVATPPVAP
jgi:hypothetical protein